MIGGACLEAATPRVIRPDAGTVRPPQVANARVAPAQQAGTSAAVSPRDFLDRHCVVCHNEKLRTADLALETLDPGAAAKNAHIWEKVIRKLRAGAMPPASRPRPDGHALDAFVTHLETAIDTAASRRPNVGRPVAHRLNRAEYANAIRELLNLEIDSVALLPPDDAGYGFDNIGDVLSVSPMLLERYMSASGKIARLALGSADIDASTHTYGVSKYLRQDDRMSEELPFGSRGGLAVRHTFPLTGDYVVRVRLLKNHRDQIRGLSQVHDLEVRLDGERLHLFTVGRERSRTKPTAQQAEEMQQYILNGDQGLDVRFRATAGPHLLAVAFLAKPAVPEGVLGPTLSVASFGFSGAAIDETEEPAVWSLRVDGPFDAQGAGDTPSRRRIFVCRPAGSSEGSGAACAKRILSSLARRAYRRPIADDELRALISFFEQGRRRGGFETGVELALRKILVSPDFLFRVERDPAGASPASSYRVTDLELASRLSFFLWSSLPDDELLDLAERGKLANPVVLEQQTRRMLADPRSSALVRNFAGQWLYLRNMELVAPDPNVFPEFDDNLREAFEQETELFLESQLREDRGVLELLTSDYTYVNERLARHYQMPKIYGSHFRRVNVSDPARRGLLGHGSILTVTSYANRTSPVLRGKWLLENLLGAPPPPPPPNVPALKEIGEDGVPPSSVRERMELHRRNPVCASCHAQMDPLGFALENFDAVGKWRVVGEGGAPIDASAVLPNGTKIAGPAQLTRTLLSRPDLFVTTLVEKLLTYALGRGVEYYDAPAVRKIVRDAEAGEYRWSSLIAGVVASPPFQMRTSESASSQTRRSQ
jgi:mono/diheme cytochrome c family protein